MVNSNDKSWILWTILAVIVGAALLFFGLDYFLGETGVAVFVGVAATSTVCLGGMAIAAVLMLLGARLSGGSGDQLVKTLGRIYEIQQRKEFQTMKGQPNSYLSGAGAPTVGQSGGYRALPVPQFVEGEVTELPPGSSASSIPMPLTGLEEEQDQDLPGQIW